MEDRVSERQYEIRVLGRLSEKTREAFTNMEVTEVPAETIISTSLKVISVERVSGR